MGGRREVGIGSRVSSPFNLKTKCTRVEVDEWEIHTESADKAAAFVKHNIITETREREGEEEEEEGARGPVKRRKPSDTGVRKALSKTNNKLALGPDSISWHLLKMIKATALGQAVLDDITLWASPKEQVKVPAVAREMIIVMIPKPGRDHAKVKGWRPIVLANTVGKLGEKPIAEDLPDIEDLWHRRAFAGRKG